MKSTILLVHKNTMTHTINLILNKFIKEFYLAIVKENSVQSQYGRHLTVSHVYLYSSHITILDCLCKESINKLYSLPLFLVPFFIPSPTIKML